MKRYFKNAICLVIAFFAASFAYSQNAARSYYQIKVYHLKAGQEAGVDNYLKAAYIPALHRAGVKTVGVFKPVVQDTADLKIYVFMPFNSLTDFEKLSQTLSGDSQYNMQGKDYLTSEWNKVAYTRVESILLRAFRDMPQPEVPKLTSSKSDRIYELRSYESGSENLAATKIKQFNDGGEIKIFKKLNFNAVFYAEVLSGPRMPNLMYMTTHNSSAERDANWVAFNNDADWKVVSKLPEYQHLVSKSDVILTHAAEYSDY
jgi:hypothetical protein